MINISNIKKWASLSDTAIVEEIGEIIQKIRLQQNLTQLQLSKMAGVNRATISQLENGRAATLLTFVQIIRALNRFDLLDNLVQEPEISPILYAKLQGKLRKRASGKKKYPNAEEPEW